MTEADIRDFLRQFGGMGQNTVPQGLALRPDIAGMRIYDEPLAGVASAEDEYLAGLDGSGGSNIAILQPKQWLPSAKSVISFFFPFTPRVRESNRIAGDPSFEWLNGRIEGQAFIINCCRAAESFLQKQGYDAVAPMTDGRFFSESKTAEEGGPSYTSNWSERHAAYACGLGTFSLSRGLITEKGVAGRFGSVITSLELPVTPRTYTGLYDNCSMCMACVRRCPVSAISGENGKEHEPCDMFLRGVLGRHSPYYGCGKCQTAVPCEAGIPKKREERRV